MRLTDTRANVVTLVATRQELSALVSGARMALALLSADHAAPEQARQLGSLLARVLTDYDTARERRMEDQPCTSRSSPSASPT